MKNMLGRAIAIAALGFQDILDKGGRPYFLHCQYIADGMDTDEEKVLAYLHDTIEDGITTIQSLRELGFPEDILSDLELLTHKKEDDYLSVYIKKIATSERATKVKKRDLEHNSMLTRLKGVSKSDFDRLEKYSYAYLYLDNKKLKN